MSAPTRLPARAAALALSLALGACALASRDDFTVADQAAARVPGFGAVRVWRRKRRYASFGV